jgi:hypothetical protein
MSLLACLHAEAALAQAAAPAPYTPPRPAAPSLPQAGLRTEGIHGSVWTSADRVVTVTMGWYWRPDLTGRVADTPLVARRGAIQCYVGIDRMPGVAQADAQGVVNQAMPRQQAALMSKFSAQQRASLVESKIANVQGIAVLSYSIVYRDTQTGQVRLRRAKEFIVSRQTRRFLDFGTKHYEISCEEPFDSGSLRGDPFVGMFLGSLKLYPPV